MWRTKQLSKGTQYFIITIEREVSLSVFKKKQHIFY